MNTEIKGTLSDAFAKRIVRGLRSHGVVAIRFGNKVLVRYADVVGYGGDYVNGSYKGISFFAYPYTDENSEWRSLSEGLQNRILDLMEKTGGKADVWDHCDLVRALTIKNEGQAP